MRRYDIKKEDILLAIESVQYDLNQEGKNRKPYIKEVANKMNIFQDMARYYIYKFGYKDKITLFRRGTSNIEEKKTRVESLEKIADELKEMNIHLKYLVSLFYMKFQGELFSDQRNNMSDWIPKDNYIRNNNIRDILESIDYIRMPFC